MRYFSCRTIRIFRFQGLSEIIHPVLVRFLVIERGAAITVTFDRFRDAPFGLFEADPAILFYLDRAFGESL